MDPVIEQKLKEAGSVKDMLQCLTDYYRLEDCRPGPMVKAGIITGLKSAVKMIKPQKR